MAPHCSVCNQYQQPGGCVELTTVAFQTNADDVAEYNEGIVARMFPEPMPPGVLWFCIEHAQVARRYADRHWADALGAIIATLASVETETSGPVQAKTIGRA